MRIGTMRVLAIKDKPEEVNCVISACSYFLPVYTLLPQNVISSIFFRFADGPKIHQSGYAGLLHEEC